MADVPAPAFNPIAIGQVVARNIVPVVGILAFGWPAANVLVLYFADTMLSMGVMFAGLASYFTRQASDDGAAARINGEAGAIAVAVFLCAVIAVPLGMPLVFVGAWATWEGFTGLLSDPGFLSGLAWQVAAAVWSYAGLWRALHDRSPEELGLKRRFALVFLRWVVILLAVYSPIGWIFGRFLPHLLVALYAATSIFAEIAPDRFLRMMPGGEVGTDAAGAARAPTERPDGAAARRRRERRQPR
ncbi:MAG TPA: DUF6498-containing protein [Casimicrobiaceae bacterium]|nr:DUF6498-containing protein [Casimicrobiaceae bacterium]